MHSYYKKEFEYKNILEGNIMKEQFNFEEFNYNIFQQYFEENIYKAEENVIHFLKKN